MYSGETNFWTNFGVSIKIYTKKTLLVVKILCKQEETKEINVLQ